VDRGNREGDTAAEVLRYMRYDVDRLLPQLARDCERAVREDGCRWPRARRCAASTTAS